MNQITINTDLHKIVITSIQTPAVEVLDLRPVTTEPLTLTGADVSIAPRFTKILADGTRLAAGSSRTDHVAVIDNTTGLMWAVESLGDPDDSDDGISQDACKARCRELRLLGFSDWDLPTRTQLAGLIDDTRHEPAIDTDAFPRVKPRWHWTSTEAAWSSASAWGVGFSYGLVDYYHGGDGFALAVRRAGQ